MPNPRFNMQVSPSRGADIKAKTGAATPSITSKAASQDMPMKTANWPGLPGKAGPNRSNGVTKAKTYAKAEGI